MASSTLNIGGGFGSDLDLIRAISLYSDEFYQKPSPDFSNEKHDFSSIPIGEWNGQHCESWVLSTCQEYGLDAFSVDLGLLGSTSGMLMLQSSKQDFCQMMGDVLGKIMYREIKLLKGTQNKLGYSSDFDSKASKHTLYTNDKHFYTGNQEDSIANRENHIPFETYDSPGETSLDSCIDEYTHTSDISHYSHSPDGSPDSQSYMESQKYENYEFDPPVVGVIDDLENLNPKDLLQIDSYEAKMAYQNNTFDLYDTQNITDHLASGGKGENIISKESEEFMDSKSLGLAKDYCGKVATTSRKQERVTRNWEFLIRLLADPRANPKLIRWEDEDQGTFFLEKPDVITSLWNSRSNKPPISYKNFARGLRYHYKSGALIKVEERQLVYGCGPKAIQLFNKLNTKESTKNQVRKLSIN